MDQRLPLQLRAVLVVLGAPEKGEAAMKILKCILKFVLRHPVWTGLAIEAVIIFLFWLFPAGAGNSPLIGVAVIYAHYPALLFVERVLGVPYSEVQFFASVGLMALLWIGLIFVIRCLLRRTKSAVERDAS